MFAVLPLFLHIMGWNDLLHDCTRMIWIIFYVRISLLPSDGADPMIKILCSDNGSEYVNRKLTEFIASVGILHLTSYPYSPKQNGVTRVLRSTSFEVYSISITWWTCSISLVEWSCEFCILLINRTPSSILHFWRSLDVLTDQCTLPSIVHLTPRVFDCVVYVYLHAHQRTKINHWHCNVSFLIMDYLKKLINVIITLPRSSKFLWMSHSISTCYLLSLTIFYFMRRTEKKCIMIIWSSSVLEMFQKTDTSFKENERSIDSTKNENFADFKKSPIALGPQLIMKIQFIVVHYLPAFTIKLFS